MKVVDDDIHMVAEACRVDSRLAFEANERLRQELFALRKVADAAAAFDRDGSKHRELVDALKEAGR